MVSKYLATLEGGGSEMLEKEVRGESVQAYSLVGE